MARMVMVLSAGAGVAWMGSVGLVVLRGTESVGAWATTAATVLAAAASTATLAAVILVTLTGVLQTWREGIAFGRELEQVERRVPAPRRHLTTVR